jgi:tetratricopeptide (TPR) repeat protein
VIEIDSKDKEAHYSKAEVLYSLGLKEDALDSFLEVIVIDREFHFIETKVIDLAFELAISNFYSSQFESTIKFCEIALNVDPPHYKCKIILEVT